MDPRGVTLEEEEGEGSWEWEREEAERSGGAERRRQPHRAGSCWHGFVYPCRGCCARAAAIAAPSFSSSCVAPTPTTIHVRDSKNASGRRLALTPEAWAAFVAPVGSSRTPD